MQSRFKLSYLTLALLAASMPATLLAETLELSTGEAAAAAAGDEALQLGETRVLGTAEQELKQAPGVSVITEEDLKKRPPVNDLSDIIRRMPGVNLTGNSSSGAYGNNRQIDLRGMGPENTLILIDGKPVSSRDSVRMGRSGERNTRGDSNWVPAEAVERIEVLRGPAAARYGSGAAGGVVNIITKAPTEKLTGSMTAYVNVPEHSEEGDTRRIGFNLAGPLVDSLSFRLYGNVNRTDGDEPSLNAGASGIDATTTAIPPAGREGVRNKDINGLLRWDLNDEHVVELEGGFSRQGNIYAGDRLFTSSGEAMAELAADGAETNTMYRRTGAITHRGNYENGASSRMTLSYEGTTNSRLNEGLAGGGEGSIGSGASRSTSQLDSYIASGEYNLPMTLGGFYQVLTVGGEYRDQRLNDSYSTRSGANISGDASPVSSTDTRALFVEDNIEIGQNLILTPGVRVDDHDKFGVNWSPSLNASYKLTNELTLKGGVARAFKAPNLYQSNPNYMYTTRGNGCPVVDGSRISGPCNIFGNANLDPETSINKELGLAWVHEGWSAGLTYFHNDYKNKIIADMGDQDIPPVVNGYRAFQWVNSGKAVVRGWEGNLDIPLLGEHGDVLKLSNNFTYMQRNHSESTGQPLSVIPEYTINSTLDYAVNDKLSLMLTATFYGEQEPRTMNMASNTEQTGEALKTRGSYELYGLSADYEFNRNLRVNLGVSNLLDKRLYREDSGTAQGAATYNEPGRAFYASVTTSF
ncbi:MULTISPECIES: FepA family TonB-dependent siderophore receptor [unclassified Pseudomonas]|uniref:FepA family TonB-dependent siderophore receptor n=1 Tax=unclassified Pseudomonas TaxID=196821 RepID=UPI002449C1C7|nr:MULTISPECIES: FepA family TonB-dependent siderophore receptor [unclassified Pseudomonas]MDG9928753.1 FepA family TonB-dependent siderophore receptor [Pseudomonas sp. GD04042]MDH0481822.1 FepA family TonB-dependent siderophore receptor [Pseudomonas sp. GD04015]MDH0603194.1 FepA family TonB-dependent siderophore receptor [Pseudomonas sp. GD03869]